LNYLEKDVGNGIISLKTLHDFPSGNNYFPKGNHEESLKGFIRQFNNLLQSSGICNVHYTGYIKFLVRKTIKYSLFFHYLVPIFKALSTG